MLLLIGTTLAVSTYMAHHFTNPVMQVLAKYHVPIILAMIFISIGFGHAWASALQTQLKKERKVSQQILELLKDLLNKDEQLVIRLLVEQKGNVTQKEIGRT